MRNLLFILYQWATRLLWGTGLSKLPPIFWLYSRLFTFLRPSGSTMEVSGVRMYSRLDGLPNSYVRTYQAYIVKGGWEEETTKLFKSIVKEGDIVVDIGANIGYYTLMASSLVGPSGKVYAFEPDPINHSLLVKNIELNGFSNIVTEQKAVSDKNGKLKFYLNKDDVGAHTLYQPKFSCDVLDVESIRLDDYFSSKKIPINFIKMDIEGAELAALLGMPNIIQANPGLKVVAEFHLPWIRRSGVDPEYFVSLLLDQYKFSVTVIQDYTRNVKSVKVSNMPDLISLCQKGVVNLLLERKE